MDKLKLGALIVVCFALTGCGKTVGSIKSAIHSAVDAGFGIYEDLKDNTKTACDMAIEKCGGLGEDDVTETPHD